MRAPRPAPWHGRPCGVQHPDRPWTCTVETDPTGRHRGAHADGTSDGVEWANGNSAGVPVPAHAIVLQAPPPDVAGASTYLAAMIAWASANGLDTQGVNSERGIVIDIDRMTVHYWTHTSVRAGIDQPIIDLDGEWVQRQAPLRVAVPDMLLLPVGAPGGAPTVRVNVTDMIPYHAHQAVLENLDDLAAHMTPQPHVPAEVGKALTATFAGLRRALVRHRPAHTSHVTSCAHCVGDGPRGPRKPATWPCPDYRDAAAGFATNLPEDPQ